MKLAEALQERADLQKKIGQLDYRLANNALVQEGEKTAEDPAELLKELETCLNRQQLLIAKINQANCETQVSGHSLTELIAYRDMLNSKINIYRHLIDTASNTAQRATASEIKILRSVDVKALQKETDEDSAKLRKLNNLIQETNWTTEI
ncbi:MAG: DIP1984 family protein [Erysipelotrichaceae bacterium]|nr:DIP1984 family protein [Erysipelotrichaceae bacterium]